MAKTRQGEKIKKKKRKLEKAKDDQGQQKTAPMRGKVLESMPREMETVYVLCILFAGKCDLLRERWQHEVHCQVYCWMYCWVSLNACILCQMAEVALRRFVK